MKSQQQCILKKGKALASSTQKCLKDHGGQLKWKAGPCLYSRT